MINMHVFLLAVGQDYAVPSQGVRLRVCSALRGDTP